MPLLIQAGQSFDLGQVKISQATRSRLLLVGKSGMLGDSCVFNTRTGGDVSASRVATSRAFFWECLNDDNKSRITALCMFCSELKKSQLPAPVFCDLCGRGDMTFSPARAKNIKSTYGQLLTTMTRALISTVYDYLVF